MKNLIKNNKKLGVGLSVLALAGLGLIGTCYAGYCKSTQPEVKKVSIMDDPFRHDPFFTDSHAHFEKAWREFDRSFPRFHIRSFHHGPRIDMVEKENRLEIQAELAGYKKEDIEVFIQNQHLVLQANSQRKKEEKSENYYLKERQSGHFKRTLRLPYDVDTNEATSSFNAGILTISIPKREQKDIEAKKIEIQ